MRALLPCLAALATAVSVAPAQSPNVSEVLGSWEGVLHAYPEILHIRLELRAEGDAIGGEASISTLEGQRANIMGNTHARARVRVMYDGISGAFRLQALEWTQSPRTLPARLMLEGVHDSRNGAIGGLVSPRRPDSSPYFALSRPATSNRLILDAARRAGRAQNVAPPSTRGADPRAAAAGAIIGAVFGGGGRNVDHMAWSAPIRAEYPQLDLKNTEMGPLYLVARNLFADEYFEKSFGKRYDVLSDQERTRQWHALRTVQGQRNQVAEAIGPLGAGFQHIGTYSVADIAVSVIAQRFIRSWRDDRTEKLKALKAESTALEQIASTNEAMGYALKFLWPSEQQAASRLVASARTRLAEPVLTITAREAINSASGYEGANTLALWGVKHDEALGWVTPEVKASLLSRVTARMDELLAPLVAADESAFAPGQGFPAVVAGNEWLDKMVHRYGFALDRAPVRDAITRLQSRRANDLAGARNEIELRIANSQTVPAVDEEIKSVLKVPGDRATPAGAAIVAAGDRKKSEIGWRERLAYFSPSERRYADPATGRLSIPPGVRMRPDTADIRMAVLRAFADAGGKWINESRVTYGFAPAMGLLDYEVSVEAVYIDAPGYVCDVAAREATPRGRPCGEQTRASSGYEAAFAVVLNFGLAESSNEFFKAFGDRGAANAMVALFDAVLKMSGPKQLTQQMVLTPDGWRLPTLASGLRLNNLSGLRDAIMSRRGG